MIVNCPNCGGTHYGSYVCPFLPEESEKNKKAAEEGFWRKRREQPSNTDCNCGEQLQRTHGHFPRGHHKPTCPAHSAEGGRDA